MAVKSLVVSNLNPNAPQFVPEFYLMVEDFSPEWWGLVQTSPAFRDYWICERQSVLEEDDVSLPDELLFETVDGEYVLEIPLEDDHALEVSAFVDDTEVCGEAVELVNLEDAQKPQGTLDNNFLRESSIGQEFLDA